MGAHHLACRNHIDRPARFECRQCRAHVCDDCAKHTWVEGGFVDLCPLCGTALTAIEGVAAAEAERDSVPDPGPSAYVARIPEFLTFVVNRSVLFMVIGLTMITLPLYWAVGHNMSMFLGILGILIIRGLEATVYFRFVSQTSFGETDIHPPEAADLVDELFGPLFRYLVALSPIIVGVAWWGLERFDSVWFGLLLFDAAPRDVLSFTGPAVLVCGGVALLPLLTIIAAISGSAVAVLNPLMWVHALRVFGVTYLVAAGAFYGLMAVDYMVVVPLLGRFRAAFDVPVFTSGVILIVAYLSMALRARVLGGLGEPYFRQLTD